MENDIIQPNELIAARLKLLHPKYAEFISSNFTIEAAKIFGRKVGLTGTRIDALANAFSLYLMFFFTFDELIESAQQGSGIGKEDATEIAYAFLAGLPEEFGAAHTYAHTIVNNTPHQVGGDDSLEQEIAEAEAAMQATSQPAEQTFSSSQSDILNGNSADKPQQ